MTSHLNQRPEPCDLLVTGAHVFSMDDQRRVYPAGAIAIDGGRIAAVGPQRLIADRYAPRRTLDARGGVVHPGFVETHVHVMNTARGAASDTLALGPGMGLNRRWWGVVEDEDEHAATLLTAAEMLVNGTTCFMEAGTVHTPDAAAEAMRALGIRGLLGDPFLWDRGEETPGEENPRAPRSLERSLERLGGQLARNDDPDALVRGYVAVFGYGTASDELLHAAKAVADRAGVVLTQHQSFGAPDVAADAHLRGDRPLLHLEDAGLLGPNCTFSHMNLLAAEEQDAVARSGMAVAWCPSCALSWGTGAAATGNHAELHRRGVPVGLASDGATSSCRYDIGLQGLLALLSTRERSGDRTALGAADVLELATRGGARAAGLDAEIGTLEPGKRADLVIRRPDLPETHPAGDPLQALVYSAGSKSVDTVLVGGRVVVADGRITGIDPEQLFRLADASAARMRERLGYPSPRLWPEVV